MYMEFCVIEIRVLFYSFEQWILLLESKNVKNSYVKIMFVPQSDQTADKDYLPRDEKTKMHYNKRLNK